MVIKTYHPYITTQDVERALDPPEQAALGEEAQAGLKRAKRRHRTELLKMCGMFLVFGIIALVVGLLLRGHWLGQLGILAGVGLIIAAPIMLVAGLVRSARRPSHRDPEGVMRSFIAELLQRVPRDYARAYQLVAPGTLGDTSVETMSEAWQEVEEAIQSTVKNQEAATCVGCDKHGSGLWTVQKWKLTDKYLQDKPHFLRCENCGTVYCGTCYLQIPTEGLLRRQRKCPNCGEQLSDRFLDIFVPDPEVSCSMRIEEISIGHEMEGRVADLDAKVTTVSKIKKLVDPDSMYQDKYNDLGERGKVRCHFHNKAVKIGEEWYLLSALPGEQAAG